MPKKVAQFELFIGFATLGLAAVMATSQAGTPDALPDDDVAQTDNNIAFVASDNRAMAEAITDARATLPQFLAAFSQPQPTWQNVTIKVGVQGHDMVENIWVTDFRMIDADNYTGLLANEPVNLQNMHLGNRITFDAARITDWSMIIDGRGYGFYTVRALLPSMSEDEATAMASFLSDDPVPAGW